MKVSVVGIGHLAEATGLCVAEAGMDLGAVTEADLVWFCEDMPIGVDDRPLVAQWGLTFATTMLMVPVDVPVLISSQLPIGTMYKLEQDYPEHVLAYNPENVRKAHAVEDFRSQARMVLGIRYGTPELVEALRVITGVLGHFTEDVVLMSPESAEMTKHVLNSYLAMCIAFANEMGDLCRELKGVDVDDVFRAFRSDLRVAGPLAPGGPYRGGTLGRDLRVLLDITDGFGDDLLRGIDQSNRGRL